jgi:hypothetical protein
VKGCLADGDGRQAQKQDMDVSFLVLPGCASMIFVMVAFVVAWPRPLLAETVFSPDTSHLVPAIAASVVDCISSFVLYYEAGKPRRVSF